MTNVRLLNNVDHAELRVRTGHGPEFGDDLNQVPVFPAEFEDAQRDYAIVFRRNDKTWVAVVLLGLDPRENLFLGGGTWHARYVPAMQRRGPFLIGDDGADPDRGPMIHIDLDHPRVSGSGSEGESLFLPRGGNAPMLERMADALRIIHEGFAATRALSAALDDAGLLAPVSLDIEIGEGRRYRIDDVSVVSREALAALDAPTLHRLNRDGSLALALLAAASLGNVSRLASLKRDRDTA